MFTFETESSGYAPNMPSPSKKPGRAAAEFPEKVKRQLAAEAGHCCANPSCYAPTHAAGSTKTGIGKVGEAAHISAAAEGFARWLPNMDADVRKSAANGIWLCDLHAREIDIDFHRFSIALLHRWKRRARVRATNARGKSESQSVSQPRELIRHTSWLGRTPGREEIAQYVTEFLSDAGAGQLWSGERLDAVQFVLYELALNAVSHGSAEELYMRARGTRVDLVHDGTDFNPNTLTTERGRGGAQALAYLADTFRNDLSINYRHNGEVATIQLIDFASAGPDQPCALTLGRLNPNDWDNKFAGCSTVHVFPHRQLSFSDSVNVQATIDSIPENTAVVLHGVNGAAGEYMVRTMPRLTAATGEP